MEYCLKGSSNDRFCLYGVGWGCTSQDLPMKNGNITCLALILSFGFAAIELDGSAADLPDPKMAIITRLDSVVKELNSKVDSNMDARVLKESDPVFYGRQEKIRRLSFELRELVQKITALWPELDGAQQNAVRESLQRLDSFAKTIYGMDTGDKKSLDNVIFQTPKKSH